MVYGYLRVSTDKQDEQSQRIGVDALATKKLLKIDEYIKDEGVSGAKEFKERNLGQLIKKLKEGDIVIISEISRIGRRLILILQFINICIEKGVKLYSAKDGYEINDSLQSKVLLTVMGLCAEIERDLIRQRTKEGLARVRANGVVLGRPKGRKTDENKLKLTKKRNLIVELLKNGTSKRKIAKICKCDRNTLDRFIKDKININEI